MFVTDLLFNGMAKIWRCFCSSSVRLEVDSLEAIIDSAYQAYTCDSTAYLHDLLPLSIYRRQYVAVVTDKGEREVWVGFLCGNIKGWRQRPIIVDDGGKCFVQLFINLRRKKVYALEPGGLA